MRGSKPNLLSISGNLCYINEVTYSISIIIPFQCSFSSNFLTFRLTKHILTGVLLHIVSLSTRMNIFYKSFSLSTTINWWLSSLFVLFSRYFLCKMSSMCSITKCYITGQSSLVDSASMLSTYEHLFQTDFVLDNAFVVLEIVL